MALALSQFGTCDKGLYAAYLLTYYACSSGVGVVTQEGVSSFGAKDGVAAQSTFGQVCAVAVDYLTGIVRAGGGRVSTGPQLDNTSAFGGCSAGNGGVRGVDGDGDATAGSDVGQSEFMCGDIGPCNVTCRGCGNVKFEHGFYGTASRGRSGAGVDGASACESGRMGGFACGQAESSVGTGGAVRSSFSAASVSEDPANHVRGKHYVQNRRKKELRAKRKKMEGSWRVGASPSVCTVDTRTAEEIEAVRTLALRRSAENKVAEQIAKHRLTSLTDEKKTQAVRELQVQRMNASINAAKAKSQACYAKCDNSLKSLGSAGSAGEFAWKKTEADLAASREEVKNLRAQMDRALAVGGPEIFAAVAEVPEPKKYGIRDVLGEPGANWTEEEIEAYYDILNAEAIGNYSTNWEAQFPRSFWDRKAKENF